MNTVLFYEKKNKQQSGNVINLRKIILQFAQRVESCPGGVGGCAPDLTQYIGGFRCTLETAAGRLGGRGN